MAKAGWRARSSNFNNRKFAMASSTLDPPFSVTVHSCRRYLLNRFSTTLFFPCPLRSCPVCYQLLYPCSAREKVASRGFLKQYGPSVWEQRKWPADQRGTECSLLQTYWQKCVFSGVKTSPPLQVRSEVSARRMQDTGTTSAGTPGLSEAAIKDSELTSGRASTTALRRSSWLRSWFCPSLQYAEKLWGENSASILGSRHGG